MLELILIAVGLVATTVILHAVALAALIRVLIRRHVLDRSSPLHVILSMIGLTFGLLLVHFVDISVWGVFYSWQGCLPDVKNAFYFSGVTYTTLGYGDIVLPKEWRMLAPVETLTGVLMCGLSSGFFFAAVSRWISNRRQTEDAANLKVNISSRPSSEQLH